MSEKLYRSTEEYLREQEPRLQLLVKDRWGGVNVEALKLQTNRQSKVYKASLWLENLILFSSVFDWAIKTVGWLCVGSIISLITQMSIIGTLCMIPIVWGLLGLAAISKGTALKWPCLYVLMLVTFSFAVSFI